jgi:N-methylhydantoinase A
MSNAARVHTVESGKDISTYTMITFGGAGPLHAARICEKTGIERFIVPPGAGVGSAIGFLRAPFSYESVRSLNQRLSQFDARKVLDLIQQLSFEAMQIVDQGAQNRSSQTEIKVLMRYVGQGWEVPVIIPKSSLDGDCAANLRSAFETTYAHFFGRTIEAMDIETISWSVKVSTPAALSEPARVLSGDEGTFTHSPLRPIFDARLGQNVMAKVIERQHLAPGQRLNGPVLVVEAETSTLVTSAFSVMAQPDGCLWVQKLPGALPANEYH